MRSMYFISGKLALSRVGAAVVCAGVLAGLATQAQGQPLAGAMADVFAPLNPSSLQSLQADPRFPDHPTFKNLLTSGLEAPSNQGDYYGQHIYGYIMPPETGNYILFVASSGQSEFRLSQSASKTNLSPTPLCRVPDFTDPRQYDKYASQASAPVYLEAGQYYYYTAVHQQAIGQDHFAVTWRKPSDITDPVTGADPIPAENLVVLLEAASATVQITRPPASLTVTAYHPATFTVEAAGTSEAGAVLAYQWYLGDFAIDGATNSSYTIAQVLPSDHLSTFKVLVSNLGASVMSSPAVLTVAADKQPPTLEAIRVGQDPATRGDAVILSFSEFIDPDSALDLGHYQFVPDWPVGIVSVNNGTNVILSGAALPLDAIYQLTVSGVRDLSRNLMSSTTQTVKSFVLLSGQLVLEDYLDIPGTALSDLTQNAKYQSGLPDRMQLLSQSLAPSNQTVNFGQKMAGFFIPSVSGDHTIALASMGNSELFLSADASAANLNPNPIATASAETQQPSTPQALTAGQKYYFEALMKQGTSGAGGNVFAIRWSMPGETNFSVVGGAHLAARADLNGARIEFTQQPADVQVLEYRSAFFQVTAQGASAYASGLAYQWTRNGIDIAGATNAAYTALLVAMTNHNDRYQCRVMLPAILTNNSAEAVLTVLKDTQPPLAVSAGSLSNCIGIRFNELMNVNAGNFTVNNGATVNMTKWINGQSAVLFLDQVVTGAVAVNFTVQDRAGNATNGSMNVAFNNLRAGDMGEPDGQGKFVDPLVPGEAYAFGAGEFDVQAGGSGLGGAADHGHFVYQSLTGDFDIRVRVKRLDPTSRWAKAGLMVRETMDAGSRNLNVVVTPSGVETRQGGLGANAYECQVRPIFNSPSASWSGGVGYNHEVPYPAAWIRLQRQGDWFTAYRSWDGQAWLSMAKVSSAGFSTVLVGLCVTASNNDTNGFTSAEFADYGNTVAPETWINRSLEPNNVLTARGENPSHNQTRAQAFDGLLSNQWLDFSASSWLQLQFTNAVARALTRYGLASGDDAPERDPRSWTLSGSTNGITWIILDSKTNQSSWTERQAWKFFAIPQPQAFNYYRLEVTNHSGDICQLSDVGLFEVGLAVAPELAITKSAGLVVMSWPETPGFVLMRSSRLGLEASWSAVGTGSLTNGIRSYTLNPVIPRMFYQLQK